MRTHQGNRSQPRGNRGQSREQNYRRPEWPGRSEEFGSGRDEREVTGLEGNSRGRGYDNYQNYGGEYLEGMGQGISSRDYQNPRSRSGSSPEFSNGQRWESESRSRARLQDDRFPGQFSDPGEFSRNRLSGSDYDAGEEWSTGSAVRGPRDDAYYSGQGTGGYGRSFDGDRSGNSYRKMDTDKWSGSISHAGKGPKGYSRSDERIKEEVCELLMDADHVDASEIDVTVERGEVTLTGTVESRQMKRAAEDVIEHISGVTEVTNQLRVKSTSNSSDKSKGEGSEKRDISSHSKHRAA